MCSCKVRDHDMFHLYVADNVIHSQCNQIGQSFSWQFFGTKVAQIFGKHFGKFERWHLGENLNTAFWATFEQNWATIYCNIWSHFTKYLGEEYDVIVMPILFLRKGSVTFRSKSQHRQMHKQTEKGKWTEANIFRTI